MHDFGHTLQTGRLKNLVLPTVKNFACCPNFESFILLPPEEIHLRRCGPLALDAYNQVLSKGKARGT